jgi:hypothetical protein
MENIIVKGTITLREEYTHAKNIDYFAIFKGNLRFNYPNLIFSSPEVEIPIRIGKHDYDELKQQLDSSDAEEPMISVEGDLELILTSACMN